MQPQFPWLRVIHGAACDGPRLREIVRQELARASAVRIVGAAPKGDPLEHWGAVGAALGAPVDLSRYGATGPWVDLGFEPNGRASARPGEAAQPLHNDCASVEALSGAVGLFHCARYAPGGGRALVIDAGAVADAARRQDGDLYDRLFETPLRFGRTGVEERVTPVLKREGNRLTIAWNEFRLLPEQSAAGQALRADMRRFLQELVLSGLAAAAPLEAGDTLFFRAGEVLHGREAPGRGAPTPVVSKTYFLSDLDDARRAA